MKYVKSIPRYAVFDGVDLSGFKLYHTLNRRYKVFIAYFGTKFIQSYNLTERY